MPQVAAHFVIADRVRPLLSASDQALIAGNQEAYKLGAIGPDMSFFLLDAAPLRPLIQTVIDVYVVISDIMKLFSDIATLALGPAADMLDWFSGGLSTATFDVIGRAMDALIKASALLLMPGAEVDVANPFAGAPNPPPGVSTAPTIRVKAGHLSTLFRAFGGHPYTFDPPYKPFLAPPAKPDDMDKWWWMDVLHYRRTGLFASALLKNAANDRERAYARGWMTHVAGDVCGHPYINSIVGGPFRNHAHRHLVVERVVDTWVHDRFTGEDIVTANLQKQCAVGDGFEAIARLLNRTIDEVYVNPVSGAQIRTKQLDGPRPSEDEWGRAYELLMRHLELSTGTGFEPPKPPPGSPAELFEEIKDHIANSAKKVPGAFTGKKKWWEWLLAPFVAAGYALATFIKLMTLPAGVLGRVGALGLRWLLYLLQKELYSCVLDMRWTLVLGGFGVASRADLSRTLAQAWIRVPAIRSGENALNYPHAMAPRVDGYWLFDPAELGTPIESGPMLLGDPMQPQCSPYLPGAFPDSFIQGRSPDPAHQAELAAMASELEDPRQTIALERLTYPRTSPFLETQFGSAVEMCAELLNDPTPELLGSFDLDGDMGYGFLNWERGGPAPTPPNPTYGSDPNLLTRRP